MTDSDTPYEEGDSTPTTDSQTPVRRRFLQLAAGGIALGIAGCSSNSGGSSGDGDNSDKTAKDQVKYQDHPNDGNQCSGCKFFISSGDGENAGKCKKVKGKIANDGWCTLYTAK